MKKNRSHSVVFVGGGTLGHVIPALVVIRAYRQRYPQLQVVWIGSKTGVEQQYLKQYPWIDYYGISCGKWRRYFSLANFTDLWKIYRGYRQAGKILKKIAPHFVFSKGGFVSVPVVWAAHRLKISCYSHESDRSFGLATRLNAPKSEKIFCSFPDTLSLYPAWKSKLFCTGQPVRDFKQDTFWTQPQALADALSPTNFPYRHKSTWLESLPIGKRLLVLVWGGSSGAQQINQWVASWPSKMYEKIFVIHQTGQQDHAWQANENYYPLPFLGSILPEVLAQADLVISRSGSGSLWELAYWGKPTIFIPLQVGSRGDQVQNALFAQKQKAGWIFRQAQYAQWNTCFEKLQNNLAQRSALGENLHKLCPSHPSAEQIIKRLPLMPELNEIQHQ